MSFPGECEHTYEYLFLASDDNDSLAGSSVITTLNALEFARRLWKYYVHRERERERTLHWSEGRTIHLDHNCELVFETEMGLHSSCVHTY